MSFPPRHRHLEVEEIHDVTVVYFTLRKIRDEENIRVIGKQLLSLVNEAGRRKILLNFRNVESFSTMVLAPLITLNQKLRQAAGKLVLCNISEDLLLPFKITRLNTILTICETEPEALQMF